METAKERFREATKTLAEVICEWIVKDIEPTELITLLYSHRTGQQHGIPIVMAGVLLVGLTYAIVITSCCCSQRGVTTPQPMAKQQLSPPTDAESEGQTSPPTAAVQIEDDV